MKYIYFLYSEIAQKGYFGSCSTTLNRRFSFHKNDSKKLVCSSACLFDNDDVKITPLLEFDDNISKNNLEIIENDYIKEYYKNQKKYLFNNKEYTILNAKLAYKNNRQICPCGCNLFLTRPSIRKHLNNI